MKARLYKKYVEEVLPALKAKRNYANLHQVPRMTNRRKRRTTMTSNEVISLSAIMVETRKL